MEASDPEYLACEPSPLGLICLRQRTLAGSADEPVTELTLDHQFLMSSAITESERALARLGIETHGGSGLRVLVGGLGLGYTAREALRSGRVARVEVAELLRPVIDWVARGVVPLGRELCADPRFAVREGDVYAQLAAPPERTHDLVLVDVDHSPDAPLARGSAAFYTEAGLRRARRHLAPKGVLGVWSCSESPRFAAALERVFDEVRVESLAFANPVVGGVETNWLYFARG